MSHDSGVLAGSILEIRVSKENIAEESFIASDIPSQIAKEVIDEWDEYSVRFYFRLKYVLVTFLVFNEFLIDI